MNEYVSITNAYEKAIKIIESLNDWLIADGAITIKSIIDYGEVVKINTQRKSLVKIFVRQPLYYGDVLNRVSRIAGSIVKAEDKKRVLISDILYDELSNTEKKKYKVAGPILKYADGDAVRKENSIG